MAATGPDWVALVLQFRDASKLIDPSLFGNFTCHLVTTNVSGNS